MLICFENKAENHKWHLNYLHLPESSKSLLMGHTANLLAGARILLLREFYML